MSNVILHLFARVADWRKRRNAMVELSRLSDATLRDIGVVRADIPRVVEQAIKAERAALLARLQSRVQPCRQESPELC